MLIVGAALFDAVSGEVIEDSGVEIVGGRIGRIGRRADFGDKKDARDTLDATGKFVMPGLINMHDHLMMKYALGSPYVATERPFADLMIHAVRVAAVTLAQGITTIRDMGTRHEVSLKIRAAVAAGDIQGPRVIACNNPIAVTGGHAYNYCAEADGADEFRAAARAQLKAGADFIKVMASHDPLPLMPGPEKTRPELTVDEMSAAFEVAHTWGTFTSCHVMGSVAIERVVEAGVDILDHGIYLNDRLAERMAEKGTVFTPTYSAYAVQTIHPRFQRGAAWKAMHELLIPGHHEAVAAAIRAGVTMVIGTDTTGCYAEEVAMLREAGLSASDTLLACTSAAAKAMRIDGEIGTLQEGKVADLIILPGNPLADPYALESVEMVIKDGRPLTPSGLTYAERQVPMGNMAELAHSPSPTRS
jgi:imidazolonepropionase-like amidohydrolase